MPWSRAGLNMTGGRIRVYKNPELDLYQQAIRWYCRRAMLESVPVGQVRWGVQPVGGAVSVDLRFLLPRPKGKPGKPVSPYHVGKPDLDNLAKAIMDGLTGTAWVDDRQVVWMTIEKAYLPADGVDPIDGGPASPVVVVVLESPPPGTQGMGFADL